MPEGHWDGSIYSQWSLIPRKDIGALFIKIKKRLYNYNQKYIFTFLQKKTHHTDFVALFIIFSIMYHLLFYQPPSFVLLILSTGRIVPKMISLDYLSKLDSWYIFIWERKKMRMIISLSLALSHTSYDSSFS